MTVGGGTAELGEAEPASSSRWPPAPSFGKEAPPTLPQGIMPLLGMSQMATMPCFPRGHFLSEVLPYVELVAPSPPCSPPSSQGCMESVRSPGPTSTTPRICSSPDSQHHPSVTVPQLTWPRTPCPSWSSSPGSLSPPGVTFQISTVAVIHTLV